MFMQRGCGNSSKFLKIQFDDRVDKHFGILAGVSFRYVDDVRLQNDGVNFAVFVELIHRRHWSVIVQPVLSSDHPEAQNMLLVVQNL